MSAVPIIVIGRNPKIASKVCEGLLPEYDVIHIILSVEQGVKDLPLVLSTPSRTPNNVDGNIGSKKYGERPLAVGVGGGFNDEMFEEMRSACRDVDEGIVWVRVDTSKIRNMPDLSDTEAYGAETAKRLKKRLNELHVGNAEGKKNQGVHFFI